LPPLLQSSRDSRTANHEPSGKRTPRQRPPIWGTILIFPARLRWLWLTLAVVLLDRASKAWFESQTVEGWHRELIHNFVYLVHSRNPGIAFGVFADSPSMTMRIVLIIGSAAVIGALAWLFVAGHSGGSLTAAGLALLLGGATGNVTDRIVHGAVTDFFEVWLGSYHWPAFNVADSAITIGAALIIIDVLFFHKHHHDVTKQQIP
jgi:signal peptidase II